MINKINKWIKSCNNKIIFPLFVEKENIVIYNYFLTTDKKQTNTLAYIQEY